jgi:prepilin-type N-terminal cleavage/methylation domain-containing protein
MKAKGFTLIELLAVIAIIGILAGLLIAGTTQARKKARIAKAQAEVKELSKAWKAYWMVYGKWPASCNGLVTMDAAKMKILSGTVDPVNNPRGLNLMEVDPKVLQVGFMDPWDKLYVVDFSKKLTQDSDQYMTTVFLPQVKRYDYE